MEKFKYQTVLGDRIVVSFQGSVNEGIVTSISDRGVVLKNQKGTHFYKWCHVQKVDGSLKNKIKRYEEALRYYAEGEHVDATYRGGGQYDIDYVEWGEIAQDALKEIDSNDE